MGRFFIPLPKHILRLLTSCALLLLPRVALAQTTLFSENFDSAWTVPSTLQSASCADPPCFWTGQGSGNTEWHRANYTTGWSSSAGAYSPLGAEGTSYSARFHSTDASSGSQGALLTPWFYIFGTHGPLALSFWYVNTSGSDSLFVSFSNDGNSYKRVLALGIQSAWTKCYANLGPAGGFSSMQIKLEAKSDDGSSDIGVDNLAVVQGLAGTTYVGPGERLTSLAQAVVEYDSAVVVVGPAAYKIKVPNEVIPIELLPLSLISVPRAGGNHLVTFGPDSSVVCTTSGSSPSSIFKLNGVNFIELDGGSGWNVFNANVAGATACVWLSPGASNNIVRRCQFSCAVDPRSSNLETFGVISCGATLSNSSDGTNNDANTIEFNTISNVQWGIYCRGAAANPNDNVIIRNNVVGPAAFGPGQIRRGGIVAQHQNALTVTENDVHNIGLLASDTAPATDAGGIEIGANTWPMAATVMTGAAVTRNKVYGIRNGKGPSAVAITVGSSVSPSNNLVANNQVFDVVASATGSDQAVGLGIGPGSGDRVVFNSLSLYGNGSAATQSAVGIRVASTSAANLTVKNNVVAVGWTSANSTLRHYCEVVPSTSFAWGLGGNDHNDYYTDPSSTQATLGGIGTVVPYTPVTTLASWRTQFTPNQDGASLSEAPPFVSSTDLHLQTGIATGLESTAIPILGVTNDFDGHLRNVSSPDIGCDEGDFTPLIVNIAPVLRDIADIIPYWGKTKTVSPVFYDVTCLPVHFTALNLPAGASINSTNGRITWPVPSCPNASYPGVTVIATDSCGAADSTTFDIYPRPSLLTSCFVREEYVPKLTAYPADANGNFIEDQLELPTEPDGASRVIRPSRSLPNVVASGDSIPGGVWLIFNQCRALDGANRDTVETRARIIFEPDIVAAALVQTVPENLPYLAGMSFVSMVAANHKFRGSLDTSARVLGVRPSSTYSPETIEDALLGVDGSGVTVVIMDSGVDADHESLIGKHRSGVMFITGTGDSTSGDPPSFHPHATSMAGAAVGMGDGVAHIGIAKAAGYADVCVLLPNGSGGTAGSEVDVIAGLQYALANYGAGTIVCLGIEGDDLTYGADPSVLWNGTDLLSTTINAVTQTGLIVVVPVGNVDVANTPLLPPAVAEDAIVVGASMHMGTVTRTDDQWAPFSKTGPREPDPDGDTTDEEIPHILVPGSDLSSGGTGIVTPLATSGNQYVGVQGTSIAAAQVAGMLALMQQVMSGGLSAQGARQLMEDTADEIIPPSAKAGRGPITAAAWNPFAGHGLLNGFRLLDQLVPQANLGFDVFCNGPGEWYYSPDIEVLDPILLGDSVRVRVTVHNKSLVRRVIGFTLEIGAYSFGNSPFQGVFHTFTDTDTLLQDGHKTFECKWYVNPGLSKPHGCLKAFINYARDSGPFDNCAQRNVDIVGYGSGNAIAGQAPGRTQTPLRAANAPPFSRMFVANVLPENVLVTLQVNQVSGSGWTLVCSETTLTFAMNKNEPPREVTFRGIPEVGASDSSVWSVNAQLKGACDAWNSGGGRVIARRGELTGVEETLVLPTTLLLSPRPFRHHLDIAFGLPAAGRIGLRFFDVMGREVRKIDLGERPPGLVRVQWDGRTNDGVDAAPGIYFVRVQLGARELGGRIIRLH